ncbi:MAG: carboxymethylenebutenolidase [Betaproteobacteria bacterium RBG_16_66_20]|nr:MAG: carboxymethylenebutenolidase [Betaproteobacteria bacterium RBG_16_66_20]
MGKFIELKAADGHNLAAYIATPAGKPRGGVVVIPEIFGVNSHIRQVTDGFAAEGYLAVAPAMFDRARRNYDTGYSQPEIEAGVAIMQKLDWKQSMLDVQAAIAEAAKGGKVGIVGYCYGGTVSWMAAARVSGLACAVPYYGGGMHGLIGERPKIPVMCNFGEADQSPTLAQAKEIAAAHPAITAHFYPGAGHGFNCDQRGSWNPEAAKLARQRTLEFFRKQLG